MAPIWEDSSFEKVFPYLRMYFMMKYKNNPKKLSSSKENVSFPTERYYSLLHDRNQFTESTRDTPYRRYALIAEIPPTLLLYMSNFTRSFEVLNCWKPRSEGYCDGCPRNESCHDSTLENISIIHSPKKKLGNFLEAWIFELMQVLKYWSSVIKYEAILQKWMRNEELVPFM